MISVLCGVKNRSEHLLQSYKSWLSCEGVDEVVIVDWGSDTPISQELEQDEKLKIVQISPSNAKHWAFSQAYNLAARFATSDYLVLMNADEIIVDKKEISELPVPDSAFFYEGILWEDVRSQGVYFLYISKDSFWSVNGYHESLIGYGYDDIDLKKRLMNSGLTKKRADIKIEHIKHGHAHSSWENYLNTEISAYIPWSLNEKLLGINFQQKGNIIYCEIDEEYRITDELIANRKKRGKVLSKRVKDFKENPGKYEMGHG